MGSNYHYDYGYAFSQLNPKEQDRARKKQIEELKAQLKEIDGWDKEKLGQLRPGTSALFVKPNEKYLLENFNQKLSLGEILLIKRLEDQLIDLI